MKSKEKRMRKLHSVKLSATRPKPHRMRSRIDGQVRIMTMLGKGVVLASWSLQQGLSELGRSYPASLTVNCDNAATTSVRTARIIRFHLGTRFTDNELRDSQISRITSSSYLHEPRLAGLPLSCGMTVNSRGRVTARGHSFAFTMR